MKTLIAVLGMAVATAVLMPASAEEGWSCARDGRLAGRATGNCQTELASGAWDITLETSGREASGEANLWIVDTGGARIDLTCYVAATVVLSCDATGGDVEVTPSAASWRVTMSQPATLTFRARPPLCGTVTCNGRDPVVSAGKITASVHAAG